MEDPNERRAPPPTDDPGRSRERERQDAMLERAAHQESWLSRLWRSMRERKAKPDSVSARPRDNRDS
jgi:hypothetical protein